MRNASCSPSEAVKAHPLALGSQHETAGATNSTTRWYIVTRPLQKDRFLHGGEGNDGPGMLNDFGRQFTTRSGGDCWSEAADAGIDVSGVE